VAGQLQNLANGQPQGVMASRQQQINQATSDLAAKTGLLQDHAEDLIGDQAAGQVAQQAAAAIARAANAQQQASSMMPNKLSQAIPSQHSASGQLQAAATALERLGQVLADAALRAQQAEKKIEEPPQPPSPILTDAIDQVNRAAQTQQLQDAELAAQLMGGLSKQARQLAESMGLSPDASVANLSLTDPFAGGGGGTGTGPQETDLTLLKLKEMGISPSDWARLPGQLRDEVLQAADEKSPPQYRSLIKKYFRELAKASRAANEDERDDDKKEKEKENK